MEDLVGRGMAVAGGSVMDEMNALFAPPGREAKTAAAGQKQKTVELHPYFKRPGSKNHTIVRTLRVRGQLVWWVDPREGRLSRVAWGGRWVG